MRELHLSRAFKRDVDMHTKEAPPARRAVREAIALFTSVAASSNDALPLGGDSIDIPGKYEPIWAHLLPTVGLVITYSFTEKDLVLKTLRRDLRPG